MRLLTRIDREAGLSVFDIKTCDLKAIISSRYAAEGCGSLVARELHRDHGAGAAKQLDTNLFWSGPVIDGYANLDIDASV
jgi:hypothetical protein